MPSPLRRFAVCFAAAISWLPFFAMLIRHIDFALSDIDLIPHAGFRQRYAASHFLRQPYFSFSLILLFSFCFAFAIRLYAAVFMPFAAARYFR